MSTQHEKKHERSALKWTKTQPSVPGAYYVWSKYQGTQLVAVEVSGILFQHRGWFGWDHLPSVEITHWYGPIELPAPPKGDQ